MVKALYVSSILAVSAAGGFAWLTARHRHVVDPQVAVLLAGPSAVELFGGRASQRGELADGQVPPLVAQARALVTT